MKKVLVTMLCMFIAIVPLGGLWSTLLKPILGGGVEETYLYPIYGGLILLSGIVVGAACVVIGEIRELKKALDSSQKSE